MMTRVLPVPAPAMTTTGPSPHSTIRRCSAVSVVVWIVGHHADATLGRSAPGRSSRSCRGALARVSAIAASPHRGRVASRQPTRVPVRPMPPRQATARIRRWPDALGCRRGAARTRRIARHVHVHDREADDLDRRRRHSRSTIVGTSAGRQLVVLDEEHERVDRRVASERRACFSRSRSCRFRKVTPCLPGRNVMPRRPGAAARPGTLDRGRPSRRGLVVESAGFGRAVGRRAARRSRVRASPRASRPGCRRCPSRIPARPPAIAAVVSVSLPYATARWIVSLYDSAPANASQADQKLSQTTPRPARSEYPWRWSSASRCAWSRRRRRRSSRPRASARAAVRSRSPASSRAR